jgi:hypothetical protein
VRLAAFARRRRARRRETVLAEMTAPLEEPGIGDVVVPGQVLAIGEQGALVALEGGLITGFVPGLAVDSRPYLVAGRSLDFRVIGRPRDPERDIDVLLWPQTG